jgi:hypothetical protein
MELSLSQQAWLRSSRMEIEMFGQLLTNDFSVHPLDGDKSSEDPGNLILIYSRDSQKLEASSSPSVSKSEQCYHLKVQGHTWASVEKQTGVDRANAHKLAKKYATNNQLKWPL